MIYAFYKDWWDSLCKHEQDSLRGAAVLVSSTTLAIGSLATLMELCSRGEQLSMAIAWCCMSSFLIGSLYGFGSALKLTRRMSKYK